MESENLTYILFSVALLIVAFFLIRKVASCLIKTVVMVVLAGILAFVYFNYIKEYKDGEQKPEVIQKMDQTVKKQLDKVDQKIHKK
jgi:ABC-type transport system involved in cytochrome c biogenesis permease subunit